MARVGKGSSVGSNRLNELKFLADMGVAPSVAIRLRELGFDAFHVVERLPGDSEDSVILELARSEERIVLTMDHDFGTLLFRLGDKSPSIVYFRTTDVRPAAVLAYLARVVSLAGTDLRRGVIVTVNDTRIRIQALPIQ